GTRDNWSAEIIPYSGGSDHAVFLGGGINIPATMFGSWPDYFYHSSGDTPDKSDPTQLKRAIVCGVLAAASLATIEGQAGLALLQTMVSRGIRRQDQAADAALAFLEKSGLRGEDLRTALNIARQKALREVEALSSMKALLPGDANMISRIEKLSAEVLAHRDLGIKRVKDRFFRDSRANDEVPETVGMSADEKKAIRLIPRRNEDFPGYFEGEFISSKLRDRKLPAVQVRLNGFQRFEAAAFINGRRDILEIWNAVRAETGAAELSDVISYLSMLESIGLIAFNEPRGS
ncbi:MAG: hypothetical protein H6P98_2960, partial [Candidatus Aminicenantes bacterium]|nr:hypothetical protein [Candidatus Aminicenantes bacterium]